MTLMERSNLKSPHQPIGILKNQYVVKVLEDVNEDSKSILPHADMSMKMQISSRLMRQSQHHAPESYNSYQWQFYLEKQNKG